MTVCSCCAPARLIRRWRESLHVVSPEALLRWHRNLFRIVWRPKSRPKRPANRLGPEVIELIQAMATDNVLWGAERIRSELPKVGIRVSKRTIQKYMRHVRPPGRRGQSWQTFIRNHTGEVWASEFLQHYDVLIRPIFAFFVVVHGTRAVGHFNVTRHPTDAWTAQQLRAATAYGEASKYLVRDNDDKGSGHNTDPATKSLNFRCAVVSYLHG
jgi:transposase